MRGLCVIVLGVLGACASTPPMPEVEAEKPANVVWDGRGLDYATTRPALLIAPPGSVIADLTLVDLDAAVAEKLLGIESATDIDSRSYREAMGEIAATTACVGNGELLDRPGIAARIGEAELYEFKRETPYLKDWELASKTASPKFGICIDGAVCKLKVSDADGAFNVQVDSVSSQLAQPIGTFTTSGAGPSLTIQTPTTSVMRRLAVETIRPGETAMFQLGRGAHSGGTRIRLLFVRIG
ncbi:MAG: hypothetical protein IPK87_01650 [Planctomycetes bacterium]|nr:hypothetical protein [Planctomycetota bacterium]